MRRRTLLTSTSAALGGFLAGCLDGTAPADGGTATPRTTDADRTATDRNAGTETNTEITADGRSTDGVTIDLTVESRDEPHAGTVEVIRHRTPACRYDEQYQCGMPARTFVGLKTTFDLEAGETRRFEPVRMGIERERQENAHVDGYVVAVKTEDGRRGQLSRLEAGAASIVGRDEAGEFPWRVDGRSYRVRATLAPETVEVAVLSVG